jgi:hypothetical protein
MSAEREIRAPKFVLREDTSKPEISNHMLERYSDLMKRG